MSSGDYLREPCTQCSSYITRNAKLSRENAELHEMLGKTVKAGLESRMLEMLERLQKRNVWNNYYDECWKVCGLCGGEMSTEVGCLDRCELQVLIEEAKK